LRVSPKAEAEAALSLSEWAEKKLVLPPERSASPGPYRIGDATFQRGMMDAITDPDNEDIVFVTSSQVGKTTIIVAGARLLLRS
jgi:phage terminase large subunit GpA-like protein